MTRPAPASTDRLDPERRREIVQRMRDGFAARNRSESVRLLQPRERQSVRLMIRCAELSIRRAGVALGALPEHPESESGLGWACDEVEEILQRLRSLFDGCRQVRAELDLAEWMAQQDGWLPMRDPATCRPARKAAS